MNGPIWTWSGWWSPPRWSSTCWRPCSSRSGSDERRRSRLAAGRTARARPGGRAPAAGRLHGPRLHRADALAGRAGCSTAPSAWTPTPTSAGPPTSAACWRSPSSASSCSTGCSGCSPLLPLSNDMAGVEPGSAWNTAISFVTNTNWQGYSGESTMGHLVQMAGLCGAELRLRRGRHRRRDRRGARLRPHADRPARQLLGRPDPRGDPDPAADLGRRRARAGARRGRAEPRPPAPTRPRWPAAASSSPAGRSPHRRSSRSSAPTAAASTTPTRRTRSRARPRGCRCSRSS